MNKCDESNAIFEIVETSIHEFHEELYPLKAKRVYHEEDTKNCFKDLNPTQQKMYVFYCAGQFKEFMRVKHALEYTLFDAHDLCQKELKDTLSSL